MTPASPVVVILAGGDGSRIGTPKLMLRAGEETFLARIARTVRETGLHQIIVVAAEHYASFVSAQAPDSTIVYIPDPSAPMIVSLQAGLRHIGADSAAVIIPVDHPFVAAATYRDLLAAAARNPQSVIKPRYRNTPGHPIILPPNVMPVVQFAGDAESLRDVLRRDDIPLQYVDVDDPGILRNINTQRDLTEHA